jgi:ABC-type transport system involved in multi-copper enzyme maturation permease subunit
MVDVLAAEWRKTLTARSTHIILGVVAVFTGLMILLALYFVSVWDSLPPEGRANASLGGLPELLGWILSLCMAVFGTLAITSEYASGMIRTTFIAMPRRGRVLAAKALVVAGVTFVVSELALALTLLASSTVIGDRVIVGQAPPDARAAVLIVAMGLSTTVFALLGLALGAIMRSALASVVSLAMLWYIVPIVARFAPDPWSELLRSVVPGALAGQLAGTGNLNSVFGAALPPWAALAAMLAYVAIPLAGALLTVMRRDA